MQTLNGHFLFFSLFVSLAAFVPTLQGHIGEFDEYWKKKADEAREAAEEAFYPDPMNVTNQFNFQVNKVMTETNSTRRNLGSKRGERCMATNPIDRCWRCDPNWASHRQRLADCVLGFGHKTVGGKYGKIYVVTDSSDNDMLNPKPGTLRHAVIQKEPLWIIFSGSMVIRLNQELMVASNKTIDSRGAKVHIAYGAGITLQFVQNVIIHGLRIHDIVSGNGGLIRDAVDHYGFRTKSDGDGISIFGSSNIWIDHVSMSNCQDGLIDVIMGSNAITISNNHFTRHNEVMLFGASDSYSGDSIMQITVSFNHFGRGLVQRMPRCRWGFFHVVNNDYTHWMMYAIGGSHNPTIVSQGNRFIAPNDTFAKEVTKRDYAVESEWKNWNWRSDNDLMMNGAFFVQSGSPITSSRRISRFHVMKSKPGTFVTRLTRFSGSLGCFKGKPC
ncbi:probable pectate lyase P59 [Populus alba]|uniref:Pectate lyase n=1 Tax=Populus alba TaxID=43335 RepID=A0A4U5NLQ6_POPAL|nr:probable pectate lyase P59 [Populus alba]TKR83640.1 pectate lyase family protein [Populus alba]